MLDGKIRFVGARGFLFYVELPRDAVAFVFSPGWRSSILDSEGNTFISQLRGPSFQGRRFASRDHSSINRLLGRASSRHLLRFEMGDKLADGALWREHFFLFFFVAFWNFLPWWKDYYREFSFVSQIWTGFAIPISEAHAKRDALAIRKHTLLNFFRLTILWYNL